MSEARVWSVLMDEMSLTDEDGGRLSLLFTAAPVLRGRSGEKEMVITKIMEENHEVEGRDTQLGDMSHAVIVFSLDQEAH